MKGVIYCFIWWCKGAWFSDPRSSFHENTDPPCVSEDSIHLAVPDQGITVFLRWFKWACRYLRIRTCCHDRGIRETETSFCLSLLVKCNRKSLIYYPSNPTAGEKMAVSIPAVAVSKGGEGWKVVTSRNKRMAPTLP